MEREQYMNIEKGFNSKWFDKHIYRGVLFFLVGILVYSSMIVNELPNPDAIWNGLYYKDDWRWEVSLGRYMLPVFMKVFGYAINPPTFTILCIVSMAIVGCLLCDLFELQGIRAVLCGMFLICSPAVAGTLTYYYCSLYYMMAYLLAVYAGWIICKKKSIKFNLVAVIYLCISSATYQAYIGVVLVIVVMHKLQQLIKEDIEIKVLIREFLNAGITVAGGILAYLISCKMIQNVLGIVAESGRGFSKMGNIPLKEIGNLLKNCYIYTYQYFFSTEMINNEYGFKKELNFLFGIILFAGFVTIIIKMKKSIVHKFLAIGMLMCIPIAVMSITIAASDVSIYDTTGVIMLPTMNYIYILLLILLRDCNTDIKNPCNIKGIYVYIIPILIAINLFSFCISMQSYAKTCKNKYDYLVKEIAHTISLNGKEHALCFVGKVENGNYPELYPELKESLHWTTASCGMIWDTFSGRQSCWRQYLKQYTGRQYDGCNSKEYDDIINSAEFKTMNNYPDENSVAVFENEEKTRTILVIKLGDI